MALCTNSLSPMEHPRRCRSFPRIGVGAAVCLADSVPSKEKHKPWVEPTLGCGAQCYTLRRPPQRGTRSKPAPQCRVLRVASGLLRHHHLHELLVVDLPVAVHVRLADHLVDLLVRQLLACGPLFFLPLDRII